MPYHCSKAIASGRLRMRPAAFFIGVGFVGESSHVFHAASSLLLRTLKSAASMWNACRRTKSQLRKALLTLL